MTTNQTEQTRVAVVTGGARGIGLAIGKWFLEHGYQVALLDIDEKHSMQLCRRLMVRLM